MEYKGIGQPGVFGAAMIEHKIKRGEAAQGNGDVIEMLKAFSELKESK